MGTTCKAVSVKGIFYEVYMIYCNDPEIVDYIKQNCLEMTDGKIAENLSIKYGEKISVNAVNKQRLKLGIKKLPGRGKSSQAINISNFPNHRNTPYTQEEAKTHYSTSSLTMIGKYINCNTKTDYLCHKCNQIKKMKPITVKSLNCVSCGCINKRTYNKTLKELQQKYSSSTVQMIGSYFNGSTPTEYKCYCGKIFSATPSRIPKSCGCLYSKQEDNLINFVDKFPDFVQFWDYEKNHPKTPENATCGKYRSYWLKINDVSIKVTINRLLKQGNKIFIKSIFNYPVNLYNKYSINNPYKLNTLPCSTKVLWICNFCNKEYQRSIYQQSKNNKCPYCQSKNRKPFIDFNDLKTKRPDLAKEWSDKNGLESKTSNFASFISKKHKIWWKCKKCKYEWLTCLKNRTGVKGTGCPKCNRSKGEYKVQKILDKYNILYTLEKTYPNCKHINKLRFDFYLPKYNICIEYQGKQHYTNNTGWSWTKYDVELRQKRDQIKRDYCTKNNIQLIEIPYWDFNNIEQIIKEQVLKIADDNISK